jgi:hypothetical protein
VRALIYRIESGSDSAGGPGGEMVPVQIARRTLETRIDKPIRLGVFVMDSPN